MATVRPSVGTTTAGATRALVVPGPARGVTAEQQPGHPAGARRRGRRERRRQLADAAEGVPPESRRGVAGGRRPDAGSHEQQTAAGRSFG
jgi:hypothetical protein